MKEKHLKTVEIRDRLNEQVDRISAWATMLEALDQKRPEILQIPSYTMGEIARSFQRSAQEIRTLVDALGRSPADAA